MRTFKGPRANGLKCEIKLFQYVMDKYNLSNDEELARFLLIGRTTLSQIRNDHKYMSARFILTTYDNTDLSIEQIREYLKEKVYVKDE